MQYPQKCLFGEPLEVERDSGYEWFTLVIERTLFFKNQSEVHDQ